MLSMPYIMATIAEVQRISRVAPVSVPHSTTEEISVVDFRFPKNSIFFANLSFFMTDPKYFENPLQFKPSRFLNSNGRYKVKTFSQFNHFDCSDT